MKQQTAVEWLYIKLSTCTSDELVGNINKWFEQAKSMEKEQIINFAEKYASTRFMSDKSRTVTEYYNETYGKQEKL